MAEYSRREKQLIVSALLLTAGVKRQWRLSAERGNSAWRIEGPIANHLRDEEIEIEQLANKVAQEIENEDV